MKIFNKRNKQPNVLQEKYKIALEDTHILTSYKEILEYIIYAKLNNMIYIPFLEWINRFKTPIFIDKFTEEQENMIVGMITKLAEIAKGLGYVREDGRTGFLFKENSV